MGGATANKAQTDRNMVMIEKATVDDQGQWIFRFEFLNYKTEGESIVFSTVSAIFTLNLLNKP